MSSLLDITEIRSQFPALSRTENGVTAAYLDGPGGTQVTSGVIAAMSAALTEGVSNLGGGFGASDHAVEITEKARVAAGRLFGASPATISFGQNMTSLTFAMSRAIARSWRPGDVIVVTSLDHDANFTPWTMAAAEVGVEVRTAEFDTETGLLDPAAVVDLLDDRVRLVAVCLASNALGSVVDVAAVSAAVHEVDALVYVDAVHAAPHLAIDVAGLDCDFLVASAYKFFGPHTGILYGREDQMASLEAYKVRPAPSDPPGKWETGTQSFESLAGVSAAVEYLESVGHQAIAAQETSLGQRFLDGLGQMGHVRLYGPPSMEDRVTTFAVSVNGHGADAVAREMAAAGIYVWAGHYYAVNVMDRLGVLDRGGLVRIGFVHYNTLDEVDRTLDVLHRLG
ncbi:MAG TPA: cysteine desulfurase-like protein [Acidimicrobiia bacterium]|nr:cysteine desulfurase-like protein [Acidimicrobiia bacterium]